MRALTAVLILVTSVLFMSTLCVGQQTCPLKIVGSNHATSHWSDGDPKTMSVTVENTSDKEIIAAQYQFTYIDALGKVYSVEKSEPVRVHESGHKTLRPGKKGTQHFEASVIHSHDKPEVSVLAVRFADNTLWEAPQK
jgi:hypothetical protein